MIFLSLLVKELRVRMRRERTTWIVISYVLLMGLLGWLFVSRSTISLGYASSGLSDTGTTLYMLLAQSELFLIIFIIPALTASTINGEKERQTYDMLLCSGLSSFSLVAAKLTASLLNALLLIAAAIPLFSMVFFFGGISFLQFLHGLMIFFATTLVIGSFGLLCSTIFQRPGISTAITYMASVVWIFLPLITLSIISATSDFGSSSSEVSTFPGWLQLSGLTAGLVGQNGTISQGQMLLAWNPVVALFNTYGPGTALPPYTFHSIGGITPRFAPWQAYWFLSLIASVIFFLLSMWLAKPNPLGRLPLLRRRRQTEDASATA
jgi:ABC-type transport system involved in multi-copper enzyme maturation permease subunit